ncbi:MAG: ATP-dependent Clp protease ATP-binding subunit, partial [Chloroflexi bacterium]|nr:ATP-dependent Clp protease ATP-binding subunit [Chloroflexota bacterium]
YTPRLRQALILAAQEAIRFRSPSVDLEHILLGMVREGKGLATTALTNLGVESSSLREAIERRLKPGEQPARGDVEYSAEANRALNLAAVEAESLNCNYIGQEHLLLALLRLDSGIVAETLSQFDVTYELARAQIIEILFKPGDANKKAKLKRYNLALPEDLFQEVELLAEREHTTVLEVIRRSVKLGLLIAQVQQTPGASFVIREGTSERQLVLL